jgi:hypothetical protein
VSTGSTRPKHRMFPQREPLSPILPIFPGALTAVMALNGIQPDFAPRGSLSLKPWIANDQGLTLPPDLALPTVVAPAPYGEQIAVRSQQIGAVMARQSMKDASGASLMDPQTQVTSVHGHRVLDLALQPLEAMFALPLVHEIADAHDRALLDVAVAAEVNLVGDPILLAADAARDAGNSPPKPCWPQSRRGAASRCSCGFW